MASYAVPPMKTPAIPIADSPDLFSTLNNFFGLFQQSASHEPNLN